MPHSDVGSNKFYIAHRNKSNKKNRLQTHIIQYIIARTLGHSLTVELRTLTPSVLVRIQLPQPKIKTPLWRFYFWFVGRAVRPRNNLLLGSKTSRFDQHRAVKSSRFPRRTYIHICPRESAAPTTLRVCDDALAGRSGTVHAKECHTKF